MTQTGLTVDRHHTQRAGEFLIQQTGFITGRRRTQHAGGQPAVDRHVVFIFLDEVGVAVIFHQAGDTGNRLVPRDALPFIGTGSAVFRISETAFAVDVIQHACAFRAQRATTDRMIGVTLYVEDIFSDVFRAIALAVNQYSATYGTVSAVVAGFTGAKQFVLAGFRQRHGRSKS